MIARIGTVKGAVFAGSVSGLALEMSGLFHYCWQGKSSNGVSDGYGNILPAIEFIGHGGAAPALNITLVLP